MRDLNLQAKDVPLLAGEVVHADQNGNIKQNIDSILQADRQPEREKETERCV